ncbi:hypothetical protein ACFZC5_18875 [Nocardia gamkensis]|jgi:hypothetical protein|uniref:hypothetical protein n=1 Tax=Nocardia gamkensis TaxID=352869 RepID=UPI0036E3513C
MFRPGERGVARRVLLGVVGGGTFLAAMFATSAAAPLPSGSGPAGAPDGSTVTLNDYCQDPGAVGHLADGRTVYCTQVQGTDAFVWSYSRDPIPRDPNTRGYTCDSDACHWPDGTAVPNYQRCGMLCGEPPTSGDRQSGLYDCVEAGTEFEECERRIR